MNTTTCQLTERQLRIKITAAFLNPANHPLKVLREADKLLTDHGYNQTEAEQFVNECIMDANEIERAEVQA